MLPSENLSLVFFIFSKIAKTKTDMDSVPSASSLSLFLNFPMNSNAELLLDQPLILFICSNQLLSVHNDFLPYS